MAAEIHDVLIIGAGPAGLAVAARLRESTPSAVFTDAEHSRYQWIKKHNGRMNIRSSKDAGSESQRRRRGEGNAMKESPSSDLDIKVLDGSGDSWLQTWESNFSALSISHLRSPMFFHPCPRDRDGLLAFAHESGAAEKCIEIANCVGKSMSKHRRKRKVANGCSVGCSTARAPLEIDERDRKDYFVPSAETFHGFCEEIVHRYGLESSVEKARVVSIEFDFPDAFGLQDYGGQTDMRIFKIKTSCGQVRFARVAVLAVGAGGSPNMPRELSAAEAEGATHSTKIPEKGLLPHYLRKKILARCLTCVMIVGGGLTAAQIADECIASGVSRVVMIMRSGLKRTSFAPLDNWQ
ncbi:MAG: hypothetical protein OHK93_004676 [Ramalina farinacea]|uniref:L-ornithine N(5)-monooxygenase [NAD(P)H] n=1 Tax=Ramalina farinacea TaxID=258253 RepID=A0AA43QXT7_9LECA|nr:hypothetical protein [Ramalina farinacea]